MYFPELVMSAAQSLCCDCRRFWEIDFLRGIAVVMMIVFHSLYDLNFFHVYKMGLYSGFSLLFVYSIGCIFILLVGISLTLSYSKTRRVITKERDVLPQLNKLSELNYISNNGDVYSIKDVLFSFWLSHVFSYYFYPITMDITARERLFDAKLEETIDIFRDTYLKDATERITDLITTFKDDYLKMRKQRIRLPHIDKTKVFSYPDKRFNFLVGEGKEIIFIGIKEDTADDNDIIDYIEKTQAFKNKKVKRIFITLNGLSTSARIIAKENRLIAWDVNDINDLLRIYRKPVIINENNSNIGYPYLYDKE